MGLQGLSSSQDNFSAAMQEPLNPTSTPPSQDRRGHILSLPPELLYAILPKLDRSHENNTTWKDARLVCKQWAATLAPMLLSCIEVIPHQYYLDQLLLDIRDSHALQTHVEEVILDIHATVNVATMFVHVHGRRGIRPGFVEAEYVQPDRSKSIHEREVEVLSQIFELLEGTTSVVLKVNENVESNCSDWARPWRLDGLKMKIGVDPDPEDGCHRKWKDYKMCSWHSTKPTVLLSTLCVLDGVERLKKLTISELSTGRIGLLQDELPIFHRIVGRLENFVLETWCWNPFDLDTGDNLSMQDAAEAATVDGIADLIQYASNCTDLSIQGDDVIDDQFQPSSKFRRFNGMIKAPAFPRLVSVFLGDINCTPDDLLNFLTVHCPILKDLVLWQINFVTAKSSEERHAKWIEFFKKLKVNNELRSFHFQCLFTVPRSVPSTGSYSPRIKLPYFPPTKNVPDLYLRTIDWMLDRSAATDVDCPLDEFEFGASTGKHGANKCAGDRHPSPEAFHM